MRVFDDKTPAVCDGCYIACTAEVTSAISRLELNSNGKNLMQASRSDHRRKRSKH